MPLNGQEIDRFYSLWFPMLNDANRLYHVNDMKRIGKGRKQDVNKAKQISDRIWQEKDFFDRFVEMHPELPEADRALALSWKRARSGLYIVERILKRGAMFISTGNEVYQVQSLNTPWEELIWGWPLPLAMDAVLLPFEDRIITDGLFYFKNIYFGPGMKAGLRELYLEAKAQKRIHTTL